ncbi:hypothetical protein [Burkholderia sp. LMG 21824]|uniref:hypothetical protein n=1 Tax=Burkholderia sp. LMG 21824 TaxID=3158172 RepID=UPI003C2BDDB5
MNIPPLPPKPPRPWGLLCVACVIFFFDVMVIYHELRNAHGFAQDGDDAMLAFESIILAIIILSALLVAVHGIRMEMEWRRHSRLHDKAAKLRDEIIDAVERGKK